jgi:hypothetical protein
MQARIVCTSSSHMSPCIEPSSSSVQCTCSFFSSAHTHTPCCFHLSLSALSLALPSLADPAFTSAAASHSLSDEGKTNAELDALLAQCDWLIQHHMAAEAAAATAPAPKPSAGTATGTGTAAATGKTSVAL